MRYAISFGIGLWLACSMAVAETPSVGTVSWQSWSPAIFRDAKAKNKLVIIDVEAVWCHWCHVMDQKTYSDSNVRKILDENFISVRVDQEAQPDIGKRYEDYGWPATVFLDGEGRELAIRSGFIEPEEMIKLLERLRKDPTPLVVSEKTSAPPKLSEIETQLRKVVAKSYDLQVGGWKGSHKYLDRTFIEDQTNLALSGDLEAKKRATTTLEAARKLVDPVWGGAYQYSVGGTWDEPHFEKIMSYQADFIQAYALSYSAWKDPKDLSSAEAIASYLEMFLTSPEGAFFTSQDADVVKGEHSADYYALDAKGRRARGVPKVDKNIYTRENGWAAEALVALYRAGANEKYLQQARRSMNWVIKNRASGEGFRHGKENSGPYFLGDQVAAGSAFLALYNATGDAAWLRASERVAKFISNQFAETSGFRTASSASEGSPLLPKPNIDENIALGRYLMLLARITGDETFRKASESAFDHLLRSEAVERSYTVCGLLLLKSEMDHDPVHMTIIGSRGAIGTEELVKEALGYAATSKFLEYIEPSTLKNGKLKVPYPIIGKPAVFVCTGARCSLPITQASTLRRKVDQIIGRKSP